MSLFVFLLSMFLFVCLSLKCLGASTRFFFRSPNCKLGTAFKYLQTVFVFLCFASGCFSSGQHNTIPWYTSTWSQMEIVRGVQRVLILVFKLSGDENADSHKYIITKGTRTYWGFVLFLVTFHGSTPENFCSAASNNNLAILVP